MHFVSTLSILKNSEKKKHILEFLLFKKKKKERKNLLAVFDELSAKLDNIEGPKQP